MTTQAKRTLKKVATPKAKPATVKKAKPATVKASAKRSVTKKTTANKTVSKPINNKRRSTKPTAAVLSKQPPQTKEYMSSSQRLWFRNKLEQMLAELRKDTKLTAANLRNQEKGLADELDRAHNEFALVVDLRENERMSNLQEKINHTLRLLDSGTYGICEDCHEQIGIERMSARPVATKCIDCKQFQERMEQHTG